MKAEINKLEREVNRQKEIALVLADRLNEKIDECEKLKRENNRLKILLDALEQENTDLREGIDVAIYS